MAVVATSALRIHAQGFGGSPYEGLKAGVDPGAPAAIAKNGELELVANFAYAESPGTLKLVYDKSKTSEKALTHGGYRTKFENWLADGSAAVWGVKFKHAGAVKITPVLKVTPQQAGKNIYVRLIQVDQKNEKTLTDSAASKTRECSEFAKQSSVQLKIPQPGFYEIHVASEKDDDAILRNSYAKFQPKHIGNGYLKTTFQSKKPGTTSVSVRYSIYHQGKAKLTVYLNEKRVGNLVVAGTGDMSRFAEAKITVPCMKGENVFELKSEKGDQIPITINRLTFGNRGLQTIRDAIDCESNLTKGEVVNATAFVGEIEKAVVEGQAVNDATVMTVRSPRAGAVHCKPLSSENPKDIVLAVVEVRIATPDQPGQYSPITTPFGYFGSTWKNLESRFGGANFSMWSEDAAARNGDITRLSRLLAYRADSKYTVFGHEGIGVKPIGENPWSSMKPTTRQILAIRKVPGKNFDTFACYFANLDTRKWELFGCGRKHNKSGRLTDLRVGHFMEVLYASPHIRRESNIRGWVMNSQGNWFQLDQLSRGGYSGAKDLSHRRHGVTDDGWFYCSTGGWFPNDVEPGVFRLPAKFRQKPSKRPAYLKGEMLESILTLPIEFGEKIKVDSTSQSARIEFNIEKGELAGTGYLYYGTKDCATFPHDIQSRGYPFVEKWKWASSHELSSLTVGKNSISIEGLKPKTTYYFRVLAHGTKYHVWSPETASFRTK